MTRLLNPPVRASAVAECIAGSIWVSHKVRVPTLLAVQWTRHPFLCTLLAGPCPSLISLHRIGRSFIVFGLTSWGNRRSVRGSLQPFANADGRGRARILRVKKSPRSMHPDPMLPKTDQGRRRRLPHHNRDYLSPTTPLPSPSLDPSALCLSWISIFPSKCKAAIASRILPSSHPSIHRICKLTQNRGRDGDGLEVHRSMSARPTGSPGLPFAFWASGAGTIISYSAKFQTSK